MLYVVFIAHCLNEGCFAQHLALLPRRFLIAPPLHFVPGYAFIDCPVAERFDGPLLLRRAGTRRLVCFITANQDRTQSVVVVVVVVVVADHGPTLRLLELPRNLFGDPFRRFGLLPNCLLLLCRYLRARRLARRRSRRGGLRSCGCTGLAGLGCPGLDWVVAAPVVTLALTAAAAAAGLDEIAHRAGLGCRNGLDTDVQGDAEFGDFQERLFPLGHDRFLYLREVVVLLVHVDVVSEVLRDPVVRCLPHSDLRLHNPDGLQ